MPITRVNQQTQNRNPTNLVDINVTNAVGVAKDRDSAQPMS